MSRYLVTLGAGTGAGKVIQSCATTVTINKKPSCKKTMKKTMIIFVSVLLVLSFPSCSGCSGQLKKVIVSALDDTPKPPKHYTTEELKTMGVNTEHLFEFTDTTMTYNGTPFMIGETIERMVEIFGPYDRKIRNIGNIYLWDDLGILITTYSVEDPQTNKINKVEISWNLDMSDHDYPTTSRDELELREMLITNNPKGDFQGKILLNGVPLGRGMNIESFLKESVNPPLRNKHLDCFYTRKLYDLDYNNIDIPNYGIIEYLIYVSQDYSDIETFSVELSY